MTQGGVISIRGLDEVQRALAQLEPAPLKKLLQKASSAGAREIKPYVVRETPKRTGKMRRSVSATQARKDRPAAIVKFRTKPAFYRHFVINGTRPHPIRFPDQKAAGVPKHDGNIQHPGAKPNPIITRAWAAGGRAAIGEVNDVIRDYLESI